MNHACSIMNPSLVISFAVLYVHRLVYAHTLEESAGLVLTLVLSSGRCVFV